MWVEVVKFSQDSFDFDGNQVVRCLESKGFNTGRHHAFAVGMTSNHPAAI